MARVCSNNDLLVFSHLRWNFVFQRPQHLMTRYANHRRVFFFEEPEFQEKCRPSLLVRDAECGVKVVVPRLPTGLHQSLQNSTLRFLVDQLVEVEGLKSPTLWYYTPMALNFSRHLKSEAVIFDCMDELSKFKFAPFDLLERESELLEKAHLVFTGGLSLYHAKKHRHSNIYPFPSSIDFHHFAQASKNLSEPQDLNQIPHPRVGFFGVVDERIDLPLLDEAAKLRPDWHFVVVGPVVKISEDSLPRRKNIHYLGMKNYADLPSYLAHWDLAMMPFELNESTQFISPTKTPEFLAAGRPVVSTAVPDVVETYGRERLIHIAYSAEEFISKGEAAMREAELDKEWILRVDEFLSGTSWDTTWQKMAALERKLTKVTTPLVQTSDTTSIPVRVA